MKWYPIVAYDTKRGKYWDVSSSNQIVKVFFEYLQYLAISGRTYNNWQHLGIILEGKGSSYKYKKR